ncbi:hypothetical protein FJ977_07535 [Mesorhizobium sp. B2-1-3A]|nr:hypothetical protein FJ977_07535 [Mesorhizobium sp. B2-1-3A]
MSKEANIHRFVILGRSKERSDAAQTAGAAPQPKGSMPGLLSVATVQNSALLHSTVKATEWIPGFPRRSFAPASPGDDEVGEVSANLVWRRAGSSGRGGRWLRAYRLPESVFST